jgi:uncharacterized cupredoxin-like copper-binding protein
VLAALSTSHKLGLAIAAATFTVFAIASSFLLPRLRPDYPGRRLGPFLFVSVLLFAGMLTAVGFFGKEAKETEASAAEVATGPAAGQGNEQSSTPATTAAGSSVQPVTVTETEWKVQLPQSTLRAGSYTIKLENKGKAPHNLTISGPGVSNTATATIAGGKSAQLKVALQKGTYKFYCSVPGHEQLGMKTDVKVS